MATQPYDPIGALGGLFAPAYIPNDPISEAAVAAWNAAHLKKPPGPDVRKAPSTPDPTDAQRNAIATALILSSGANATDAGGLGLGGGAPADTTAPTGGGGSPSGSTSGGRGSIDQAKEAGDRGDITPAGPPGPTGSSSTGSPSTVGPVDTGIEVQTGGLTPEGTVAGSISGAGAFGSGMSGTTPFGGASFDGFGPGVQGPAENATSAPASNAVVGGGAMAGPYGVSITDDPANARGDTPTTVLGNSQQYGGKAGSGFPSVSPKDDQVQSFDERFGSVPAAPAAPAAPTSSTAPSGPQGPQQEAPPGTVAPEIAPMGFMDPSTADSLTLGTPSPMGFGFGVETTAPGGTIGGGPVGANSGAIGAGGYGGYGAPNIGQAVGFGNAPGSTTGGMQLGAPSIDPASALAMGMEPGMGGGYGDADTGGAGTGGPGPGGSATENAAVGAGTVGGFGNPGNENAAAGLNYGGNALDLNGINAANAATEAAQNPGIEPGAVNGGYDLSPQGIEAALQGAVAGGDLSAGIAAAGNTGAGLGPAGIGLGNDTAY